ncbi:hypothetical protein C9I98_10140 [Photobacterium sanctipauli]|uniref:DUF2946 domain-containing protein n=1 Tax=Photobacterium sanctipauli TaxID=1342794 RepID=A0A2T3NUC1_9GAMM|nr:hypothetical protein [Photobacterium sanctipauli]PSW19815.1 hypothetical protein C9I98_10140 [Photobacterium sanctipauli]
MTITPINRLHQQRTQMVCFAIIVSLLMTNLIASIVVLNPHQDTAQNSHWLTGDKVLICTSAGLQWVDVTNLNGQSSKPAETDHKQHSDQYNFHCPVFKLTQVTPFEATASVGADFHLTHHISNTGHDFIPVQQQIYYLFAPKHSPPMV